MRSKKLCYGLLLVLFTIFGLSLNVYYDVNAVSSYINQYGIYGSSMNVYPDTSCRPYSFQEGFHENESITRCAITSFLIETGDVDINGNNITITAKVNLVLTNGNYLDWHSLDRMKILGLSINHAGGTTAITPTSSNYQYYNTKWTGVTPINSISTVNRTLTVYFNATGTLPNNLVGTVGKVRALFGVSATHGSTSQSDTMVYGGSTNFYFENTDTMPIVNFSNSSSDNQNQAVVDSLSIMINQNTVINRNIENISGKIDEQNQQDQQDRDNLNQVSDNTDNSSSDSQQQAEQTGTTLLGAFSAFVTALTNASPSNCNLDMDLGNLDLGVVDLCQLSPPQPIPTIASIFLILFCVPLSIATAKKVINLFRSFQ